MDQDFNEVFGLWVRTHRGKLQVLVETRPGEWRQVFLDEFDSKQDLMSNIINPAGIRRAPFVKIGG